MNEKSISILVERGEETFEFGEPTRLPDGRVTVGVVNHSHDDPEEHVYSVFFDVSSDSEGTHVQATRCTGPAFKYHDGDSCKHCDAAEQCGELLGRVIEAALDGDDADEDSETAMEQEDAHAPAIATDGGGMVICECGSYEIQITSSSEQRDDSGHVIKFRENYRCPVCGGTGTIRSDHGRETQSGCLTTAGA